MKYLLLTVLLCSTMYAQLVNGIALVVNGQPITLLEISQLAQQENISKEKAQKELMRQAVSTSIAKEHQVVIEDEEVHMQIESIMQKNSLNKEEFKQQLQLQGLTMDTFFERIKAQQLQQRLMQALTFNKVDTPTQEDKELFYAQHKEEFATPKTIKVTHYQSANQNSLAAIKRSPLFAPRDVQQTQQEIDLQSINGQLAQLLLATKEGEYTQILPMGNSFAMFLVEEIGTKDIPSFEEIEPKLGMMIQNKKQAEIMKQTFDDALHKANIEYIRVQKLQE